VLSMFLATASIVRCWLTGQKSAEAIVPLMDKPTLPGDYCTGGAGDSGKG